MNGGSSSSGNVTGTGNETTSASPSCSSSTIDVRTHHDVDLDFSKYDLLSTIVTEIPQTRGLTLDQYNLTKTIIE